ncbi:MAG: hypothetical protein ACYCWW_20635, partial [Deltaproteobacteria bacterium]
MSMAKIVLFSAALALTACGQTRLSGTAGDTGGSTGGAGSSGSGTTGIGVGGTTGTASGGKTTTAGKTGGATGGTTGGTSTGTTGGSTGGVSGPSCPGTGVYCGSDGVTNGTANTLYQCAGLGQPPTSSQACAQGCLVQPNGYDDYCKGGGLV